jgi:pimeloyl-ACP methyl ester carboxylesterase
MSKFFRALALVLLMTCASPVQAAEEKDTVVLLHGIARGAGSMSNLEKSFVRAGYAVLNVEYPSRKSALEVLAAGLHADISAVAARSRHVHFIGHSMGGLLIRAYLSKHRPENLGRVVMIGTPNGGSEVADWLGDTWLYRKFYGPAGQQLKTSAGYDAMFGAPDYPVGTIAGNWTVDPLCYFIIPGANDGNVSVKSVRLAGETDHIVLPVTHSFMQQNSVVVKQAVHFIEHGRFSRD